MFYGYQRFQIFIRTIKYHIDNSQANNLLVFSVIENNAVITYIYDKNEYYVIILEKLRKTAGYYLLTAYYLTGKDKARDKIMKNIREGYQKLTKAENA